MASVFKILLWSAVAMIFCGSGSSLMKETGSRSELGSTKILRGAGSGSIKNLTASTSLNLTSQYSTIMISLRDAGMITIVKRLIQGRSNVIRVRVGPKSHHRRKNEASALSWPRCRVCVVGCTAFIITAIAGTLWWRRT